MSDKTTLEADLAQQKARNAKMLHLLAMMERLWPDDEKDNVRSLIAQEEATKNVLRDCSERLEHLK